MVIPNDIIYLISEYNNGIMDSIRLSCINKGIYDNSEKIYLERPFITYKNCKVISKYKFDRYGIEDNLIIRNINKIYLRMNKYFLNDINFLKMVPKNIKDLSINFNGGAEIFDLGEYQIESIVIQKLGKAKIILPSNLKYLIFGEHFNQPINLPNGLTYLTFGEEFNQPINLPDSLTHLTFGDEFDQPITLPNSLRRLTFGRRFDQPISLPNSLTHLTFGRYFNQPITLPNNLTHLTFGHSFNQPINLINKDTGKILENLKFVKFGSDFRSEVRIGLIDNKSRKIQILLNLKYLDNIFPYEYNFENYILTDITNKMKFIYL